MRFYITFLHQLANTVLFGFRPERKPTLRERLTRLRFWIEDRTGVWWHFARFRKGTRFIVIFRLGGAPEGVDLCPVEIGLLGFTFMAGRVR